MVSTMTKKDKDETTSSSIPSVLNFDSQNQGGQHQSQSRSRKDNKGAAADSLDTSDHVVGVDNANSENNDFVWYFGYGPICHPQVRARRSIVSQNHQPCVLRDYRLTFAFGGAATLVPAMGFTVHGVLMQIARHDGSEETEGENKKDTKPSSWKRLQDFDAGYSVQTVQVVPYTYTPQLDFDDDFFDDHEDKLQDCFAFVMLDEYDENLLEQHDGSNLEKKPQERYLRLIAQGMLQTGVSPDYVNDEILAVPFVPTRSEAEWISFPSSRGASRLPKISFAKYQRLCARVQNEPEVFFVLHRHVLRLVLVDPSDPQYDPTRNMGKDKRRKSQRRSQRTTTAAGVCKESSHSQTASTTTSQAWNNNPSVQWMKQNAHGAGDLTHISHVIVTDPAVPWAPTPADLTDLHYRWAENQMYDFLMQSNVSAEKVYQLVDNNNNNKNKDKVENKETSKKPPSRRLSLWARKLGCVVPGRGPPSAPEEDDNEAATRLPSSNNDKGHNNNKDDDNKTKDANDPSQNNNGSSATELLREETTSRSNATASELLPHPSSSSSSCQENMKDEEHGCGAANHETNEQHEVVGLGNVEREIMRRTAEKASVQHFTPVSSRHFHQEENVGNGEDDDREEKKQNNDVEVLGEGTTASFQPADTILETDNETNAINPTVEAVS